MTPISSSNRACSPSDAVLFVDEPVGTASPARTIKTGPIRLPLEAPATFVQQFNRIYAAIGLRTTVNADLLIRKDSNLGIGNKMSSKVSTETLLNKECVPCEGGIPRITKPDADVYLQSVPDWSIDEAGKAIFRKVEASDFTGAVQLIQRLADLAEQEQHHPDLHLTGYRHVRIELTTHAIDGLSENDFVVAAKIDRLLETN